MPDLDDLIHQPARLPNHRRSPASDRVEQVDFSLKEKLAPPTETWARTCARWRRPATILVEKTFVERRPKTFVAASAAGRKAFAAHVAALQSILGRK